MNAFPVAHGPYRSSVASGGLLFCSGQIPVSPETGALVAGPVEDAVRQCLVNLDAVVRAAGSSLEDLVKVTVYLTDLGDAPAMNEAYVGFFAGRPLPARTTVVVAALPKGATVEIDGIATLPTIHP